MVVSCAVCKQAVDCAGLLSQKDLASVLPLFLRDGGAIVSYYAGLKRLCELVHWAGVAKNLQERLPLAGGVQLVRLSILEGDGLTLGSVTSSVKDGRQIGQAKHSTSYMEALLQERVTGDGRHQCMWQDCMKI